MTSSNIAAHTGRAMSFIAVGLAVYGSVEYNHPVVAIVVGVVGFICAAMVNT